MAQNINEPTIWSSLDWSQLYDKDPTRNKQRRLWALNTLKIILSGHNVAIDADTGAGKAIMAILVHLGLKWNTLFLVPTVELAYQHKKLFQKLTGHSSGVLVMTGNKTATRRAKLWQDKSLKLVLATPQTIMSDLKRKTFPKGHFALLTIDEFHHAHGKYDYVSIAKAAHKAGAVILSLSATGEDELAKANCYVVKTIKADIIMPKKDYITSVAQPTESLTLAGQYCNELISSITEGLNYLGLISSNTYYLTIEQLKMIKEKASKLPYPSDREAFKLIGRYRSLNYLKSVLYTCSYKNFILSAEQLFHKKESYANWLADNELFNQLLSFVRAIKEEHPLVEKTISLAKYRAEQGDTFITFVNNKETGRYLAEKMNEAGVVTDTAFGGIERKYINNVRRKVEANELNCIIGSSAITEGVALPNVDTVINYHRPLTQVEWIQRAGRAGRGLKPGIIFSVVLNYPPEWAGLKKTRPQKQVASTIPNSNTLWLFTPGEMLPPKTVSTKEKIKSYAMALYKEK